MVQAGYTTDRLLQIGRSNYDRLCLFCENLERSGLWEQARQVMKQSAKMILDRYVQSVLVTFAAAEGIVTESERRVYCYYHGFQSISSFTGDPCERRD